jgi:hypothetical protein
MKDALGHGSNGMGVHAQAIYALPRGLRVEKQITAPVRTAAGQIKHDVGSVWQKVATGKRRAVAERIAQHTRIDNPNSRIRIR